MVIFDDDTRWFFMGDEFEFGAVQKVGAYGGSVICLMSYYEEHDPFFCISVIKKITFHEQQSHQESLLAVNNMLTDVTVSSSGNIWAVDCLGHLYSSKDGLSGKNVDDELDVHRSALDWSFQGVTTGVPVCIIGEDNDLWVATDQGKIIHYDGQCFTERPGMVNPIRFKKVNGNYLLVGFGGQIMKCVNNQWIKLPLDSSVPVGIPINDVTMLDGKVMAVSKAGLLLVQQDNGVFTVLFDAHDASWFGCDELNGSVYLASGGHGVYMFEGGNLVSIKDRGFMVGVAVVNDEILLLDSEPSKPVFVRHTPLDGGKWMQVKA